jgi:hypothetical protein
MPSHYTDVEKLLLQRWTDVRALMIAYDELQDSMEEMLSYVGEELEKWAEDRGYSLEADARGAEYTMWKEDWANRRNDAAIWFAVGGFVPEGYRKCKYPHPYVWVGTDLERLRIKSSLHGQFARDIRAGVGNELVNWQDPEVDDAMPLGRYLKDYDDAQRVQWMTSPASLAEFVKSAFEQLLPLAEPIDTVLKQYR